MSVLPIQNVSFTKSKMSVLQNPKCQFYITKPNLKKDTKEKDAKEKKGEKQFISFIKTTYLLNIGLRGRQTLLAT